LAGTGKITAATKEIYGKVSGSVTKLRVQPGSSVFADQVVMNIDSHEVALELSGVETEIKKCLAKINSLSRRAEFDVK